MSIDLNARAMENAHTPVAFGEEGKWRRGRDSNPWKPSGFNGFQDRRLKPLGHLSVLLIVTSNF